MLTILPVALLLITSLAVFILRYVQRGTGYAWILSVSVSFLVWGGVVALHYYHPASLIVSAWRPFDPENADAIRFTWDSVSWPYAFSLISAVSAVLLTSAARLKLNSGPLTWATGLTLAGAGITAVLASTPLAILLSWTIVDILDLLLVLRLSNHSRFTSRAVIAFMIRTISSFLLIGSLAVQRGSEIPLTFTAMTTTTTLMVIISIGLRLGLLPLNTPYAEDLPTQRGVISFIRLAAYAAGLAPLGRIPQLDLPAGWFTAFYVITIIACLYGAGMWLFAKDEIRGRPFWLMALSGLAFISVLNGQPGASIVWGTVMITIGISLFLFTARSSGLRILLGLGLIALTGLPFTPAAGGWAGVFSLPVDAGFLTIIVVGLLLAGFIRHILRPDDKFSDQDGWVRGAYLIGLIILIIATWINAFLGIPGWQTASNWLPASLAVLLVVGIFIFRYRYLPEHTANIPLYAQTAGWLPRIGRGVAYVLSLNWVYGFAWYVYRGIRRIVNFLTVIFEGEGGMMWAFVLLALLFTILSARGVFR